MKKTKQRFCLLALCILGAQSANENPKGVTDYPSTFGTVTAKPAAMGFEIGDDLEVNYLGRGTWYKAWYAGPDEKRREDFVSVIYTDTPRILGVPIRNVRRRKREAAQAAGDSTSMYGEYRDSYYPKEDDSMHKLVNPLEPAPLSLLKQTVPKPVAPKVTSNEVGRRDYEKEDQVVNESIIHKLPRERFQKGWTAYQKSFPENHVYHKIKDVKGDMVEVQQYGKTRTCTRWFKQTEFIPVARWKRKQNDSTEAWVNWLNGKGRKPRQYPHKLGEPDDVEVELMEHIPRTNEWRVRIFSKKKKSLSWSVPADELTSLTEPLSLPFVNITDEPPYADYGGYEESEK